MGAVVAPDVVAFGLRLVWPPRYPPARVPPVHVVTTCRRHRFPRCAYLVRWYCGACGRRWVRDRGGRMRRCG